MDVQPGEPKDPNVYSFMMQLVQEKHGDDVDAEFLQNESDRLYLEFGDKLVSVFEPMLSEEQKQVFDSMVEQNSSQENILGFLTESIENLEDRIMDVLIKYKQEYINNGNA